MEKDDTEKFKVQKCCYNSIELNTGMKLILILYATCCLCQITTGIFQLVNGNFLGLIQFVYAVPIIYLVYWAYQYYTQDLGLY